MDDQRLGSLLRVLRIRRGLRQIDVAVLAGVSDQTISRIERGRLEDTHLAILRRVARALEARVDIGIWTRSGEVERLASQRHAELVEAVANALVESGWIARPEVSFSIAGERGLIDILAWHAPARTLLVIEVKTEIVDIGEAIGTLDRKRRLAPEIASRLGWMPIACSTALIVDDTTTNHRRIREHGATFRGVLPDGGLRVRSFIRRPTSTGVVAGVAFWSIRRSGSVRRRSGGVRRVRRQLSAGPRSIPSAPKRCGSILTGRSEPTPVDLDAEATGSVGMAKRWPDTANPRRH
jgi:transcriptional regulator with XRE-family HTH domain